MYVIAEKQSKKKKEEEEEEERKILGETLQFTTKQKDNFSNIWKASTNQKAKDE